MILQDVVKLFLKLKLYGIISRQLRYGRKEERI